MKYIFLGLIMLQVLPFKKSQLQNSRVKIAYEQKEGVVKNYFKEKSLDFENFELFIRAFKSEKILEVWIKPKTSDKFTLLHQYEFCTSSGTLGPKRKEGDLQIPEGVYHINNFNPQSNFYLSLGLNYPNASDKILSDKKRPGSAIYIHGNCVTIGCIPITDDKIKELYILAVEAKSNGQEKIPVHIFPARLTDEGLATLKRNYTTSGHMAFWENLKKIYDDFEKDKQLKAVKTNSNGLYFF
ncbi:MAG TPA: L,D-transpeptidase family protein [Chryseolinea sp.]|jgi:murein L,D-transpeptidase YafK|nr:L,D-transpeptidase family protein [Chryseolinea sp.]